MKYFIEITNNIHGGQGWELGEVLWSPVGSTWNNIMKTPQKGDIIIHCVKEKRSAYRFSGISIVDFPAIVTAIKPQKPDVWEKYSEFFRIELNNYVEFENKRFVQAFLDENISLLDLHRKDKPFYTVKNHLAQKYLSLLNKEIFEKILEYVDYPKSLTFENSSTIVRLGNTEFVYTRSSNNTPERVQTTVSRIIRDTSIIRSLKNTYENRCQICNTRISTVSGGYCEGHHIKPLGGFHQGPDCMENIILLCPNHHVEFDLGSMAIEPKSMRIEHIDPNNSYHHKPLSYYRKDLERIFLEYHYKNIFSNQ